MKDFYKYSFGLFGKLIYVFIGIILIFLGIGIHDFIKYGDWLSFYILGFLFVIYHVIFLFVYFDDKKNIN